ncbi:hypothetical protein GQ600_12557 [Phytophthora cactorum]|nr:hypothetical protein GQ600_12557 [Phytophthora cactorum]
MAGLSEEKVLFPFVFLLSECLLRGTDADISTAKRRKTKPTVQTDSYNCGVYVLLAFKVFCGAEPLGHLDKKTLQCLRYRYLRMCMED